MYKLVIILFITITMCACKTKNTIEPVRNFDANRYMGKWYEIARLPNSFEKGLSAVTAEYQLLDNGRVKVINSGTDSAGQRKQSTGKARFLEDQETARLKVTFFWPFGGEYKVIHLDEDYQHVVVCSSGYKYLWILSRTETLDNNTLNNLISRCKDWGFDTDKLVFPSP